MEEKFSVAWEESGCVFSVKGRIESADMRRLALREFVDERFANAEYMIVDLLEADYSRISQREISMVIGHTFDTSSENPGMKLALVATDPHVVRMCEYYLSIMSKMDMRWESRMFGTMADARRWVGG